MTIAMIGLRGLPATYGGVERHVEEIGARLADRGHRVTVHCRAGYSPTRLAHYRGMSLATKSAPRQSGVEALVHSARAAAHVSWRNFDVAHFHALGPALFTPIPKYLGGAAVVQTVHGRDDERAKWSPMAQRLLRAGAEMSARVPHEVIVVSNDLVRHYQDSHQRATTYVPNGAPAVQTVDPDLLRKFGLKPGNYAMFLGRLVPEKDPAVLIRAFRKVDTSMRLAIVGGSSGTDAYADELRQLGESDERIVFCDYQYGADLLALLAHARVFVQPSLLEGLPITLLEAAAYRRAVIASDIPPHQEVIRNPGLGRMLFRAGDEDDLAAALRRSLGDPQGLRFGADELHADVTGRYDWNAATDQVEEIYQRAMLKRRDRRTVVVPGPRRPPSPVEVPACEEADIAVPVQAERSMAPDHQPVDRQGTPSQVVRL